LTSTSAPSPYLYSRLRLLASASVTAALAVSGFRSGALAPLVFSAALVGVALTDVAGSRASARGSMLLAGAESTACLIATVGLGQSGLVAIGSGLVVLLGFATVARRLHAAVYGGALMCVTLAAGWFGGLGLGHALPFAAIICGSTAFGLLTLGCVQRAECDVERLKRELDQFRTEQRTNSDNLVRLYQASCATSQEAEPGGIMDMLAEDARRLVGCESASVAIFIEKDLLASVNKGISNEFKRNLRWRVRKDGMTHWVLTNGKPLLINDAEADPRSRGSSAVKIGKLRSILAVPMMVKDEVFGILYVGDTRDKCFGERDLMLVSILANHAAASIKQARLHRELKRKLEELENAHKELIGADRLKSEFISAVTSQMRVPLDAIRTYSQTVLQRMDDTSFRLKKKFLGAVVDETAKLLNTVNGVIDLSRLEFGEGDLRAEPVRITQVLKDVCSALAPLCIDKQVEVVMETPQEVSPADLDKDMIFLLFRNLLEAAIGFARESAPVCIATEEDDSFVKVRISLAPSSKAVGMENAIQAISGKDLIPTDAGSVGLTLQVSKNIVFRHGGRIWAETHDPARWSFIVIFGKEKKTILPSDLMLEIMTTRPELKRMLTLVVDMICKVVEVERCLLFLDDSASGNLVLGAGVNSPASGGSGLVVKNGEGLTGKVFTEGTPIILNFKSPAADSGTSETLPFEKVPCISVPIRLKSRVVGVITVSDKVGDDALFNDDDLCLLAALADRIGVALERATGYESARDQFVSAMVAMRSLLEARQTYGSKPHETKKLVVELAHAMGLSEEEVRLLQYVSRVYDVGMVKVGEGILRRRGGLRVGEYESVKRHPEDGVEIMGPIEFLEQVKEVILHHHERYDGGGYPSGLAGEAIPVGARILAVVDSYGSMVSDRPYRPAMSVEEAVEELRRCSGTQFDPTVVERLTGILERVRQGQPVKEEV
jgi:GAF domain-containing protein